MADSLNKKKATRPEGETTSTDRNESVTISDIEKLFSLMRENEIAELEIEQNKTKIHIVSKGAPASQQQPMMQYMPSGMQHMQMMPMQHQQGDQGSSQHSQPQQSSQSAASSKAQAADADDTTDNLPANARTILSPMVGTFYRAASPEAPPFVKEGDSVSDDTVLCIIEAMKLMNEIKAETRGKILRVLVEDGMPVEFNQPLFVLE